MKAQNIFLDENTGGKGRYFKARFLQPGLVKYSFGVCLLEKETIDKFIFDFVGCPVIIGHNDVTNDNKDELVCGNICHIWYDQQDGWYWGDGIIDNQEALNKIEDGFNVSCQYEITEYSNNTEEKLHNGNPYDKVILNGKPEHLAIVETPRYENAMIAVNALDLTAENEDKWITVKPNGEDAKGRHLLIKEGESVEDAMHRNGWYSKRQAKETQKTERIEARRKHQEVVKKHNQAYKDFEDGKISMEELDKADKELEKSNKEFYGQPDTKDKQSDEEIRKPNEEFYGQPDKKEDKISKHEDKIPKAYRRNEQTKALWLYKNNYITRDEWEEYRKQAQNSLTDNIKQAINDIKESTMFKNLFKTKENKMDEEKLKNLFMECLVELKAKNEEDEAEEEKKEEETKKEAENKCKNEDVDKRDIIRKIAAIAGLEEDDEKVRTIIKLAEELAYDKSEAGTADNAKKAKCEEEEKEEKKEEAKNKAKNSIEELKGLISSIGTVKPASKYITKAEAIALGDKLFG